jgi:hypothetical protein
MIISARDNDIAVSDYSIISNSGPNADNPTANNGVLATAKYQVSGGTSMACPLAAGVAALLLQANPGLTPQEIRAALQNNAINKGITGPDTTYGYGLLDALGALQDISLPPMAESAATNVTGDIITITFDKEMSDPAGRHGQFKYRVNGGDPQNFSSSMLDTDETRINLTTSGTVISYGDTVTVSYTAGDVSAFDFGKLASFSDYAVTNNVMSDIATVTSEIYTVSTGGTAEETISGVLPGTSKANFLAVLTKGQPAQTWNDSGIDDPAITGNTLVVTAQNGTTIVTYLITVEELVSITLTPTDLITTSGKTHQYTATGIYSGNIISDITNSVVWESSEPDIATITEGGLVTAVSPGTTVISATSDNINKNTILEVVEGACIQGETREANGETLTDVTLTLNGEISVVSSLEGTYEIIEEIIGTHTVVASKAGFRNQTLTINVTDLATYTLNFKANSGLVPDAPDLSYVLACIHKWKYPPEGLGLNLSKVLSVINAWKYPAH